MLCKENKANIVRRCIFLDSLFTFLRVKAERQGQLVTSFHRRWFYDQGVRHHAEFLRCRLDLDGVTRREANSRHHMASAGWGDIRTEAFSAGQVVEGLVDTWAESQEMNHSPAFPIAADANHTGFVASNSGNWFSYSAELQMSRWALWTQNYGVGKNQVLSRCSRVVSAPSLLFLYFIFI